MSRKTKLCSIIHHGIHLSLRNIQSTYSKKRYSASVRILGRSELFNIYKHTVISLHICEKYAVYTIHISSNRRINN